MINVSIQQLHSYFNIPCIQCTNKYAGVFHEKIYRRQSSGSGKLHNREQCYRSAGGKKVWDKQEYDTYGCNNIERYKSKLIWIIE